MGSCIFILPTGLGPIPIIIYFDIQIVPDLAVGASLRGEKI